VPVAVAFNRVKAEIGAVGKNRKNQAQGYSFRSIEDFIDAASPVMARHGVLFLPAGREHRLYHFDRVTSSGKASTSTVATVTMGWIVVGPMGDQLPEMTTFGEGGDTADKATNKAMSAAFKYALAEALCIPLRLQDCDDGQDMGEYDARPPGATRQPRKAAASTAKKSGSSRAKTADKAADDPTLPEAQVRLRDRMRALPDAHRKGVGAWCVDQSIDLRQPVSDDVLKLVSEHLDNLPSEAPDAE